MHALILAGGTGSRLWPVSREMYPKQFLSLNGDESLLRETAERISGGVERIAVSTNGDQFFYVRDELSGIVDEGDIIVEPEKRDTGPAIALASLFAEERFGDEPLLVLPSDHVLGADFLEIAQEAEELADDRIITFGIEPTHPATGYGYIRAGEKVGAGYEVEEFVEKPSRERAEELIEGGSLWNAGIFLFKPSVLKEELRKHSPEIGSRMSGYDELKENFEDLPSVSIDYALMERSSRAATVPFGGRWKDVGSWESVHDLMSKDERGNATKGDVLLRDADDTLVYGGDRLITGIGLDDLLVVDTDDALLIAEKGRAQEVKGIVKELRKQDRREARVHTTVHKPWGYYSLLDEGRRYGVKRLCIYPENSISLQRHTHRAEHWIVVKGTARVTKGEEEVFVHENESIYIPKSVVHRLENPGKVDLHIVEIQTGEYLAEDDIERLGDDYGRI